MSEQAIRQAVGRQGEWTPSKHHPSCTPNDRDLVWLCSQCGGHESAEYIAEELAAERQRAEQAEQERESESLLLATVNAYIRDATVRVFGSKYGSTGDESAATPNCVKRFLADLVDQLLSALAAIEKIKGLNLTRHDLGAKYVLIDIFEIVSAVDLSLLHEHDTKLFTQVGWYQDSEGKWNCPSLHLHGRDKPCIGDYKLRDAAIRDEENAKIMRALNVTLDAVGAPQDEWPCTRILKLTEKVRKPLVELLRDAGCRLRELTRCYEQQWGKDHTRYFHELIKRIDWTLAQCKQP